MNTKGKNDAPAGMAEEDAIARPRPRETTRDFTSPHLAAGGRAPGTFGGGAGTRGTGTRGDRGATPVPPERRAGLRRDAGKLMERAGALATEALELLKQGDTMHTTQLRVEQIASECQVIGRAMNRASSHEIPVVGAGVPLSVEEQTTPIEPLEG